MMNKQQCRKQKKLPGGTVDLNKSKNTNTKKLIIAKNSPTLIKYIKCYRQKRFLKPFY